MSVSQLDGIPNWGAETLQGFDLSNLKEGQRISGSRRQLVRFYKKKFLDMQGVRVDKIQQGMYPSVSERVLEAKAVPVEREYVEIITPGDKNIIDTFASEEHKREFWPQYKAFRAGKSAPIGTSIDECEFIAPNIALELRYHGVLTVEQFADSSDLLCGQIPCGWELREYARSVCKCNEENQSLNQVNILRIELESSQKMIKDLQTQMSRIVNAQGEPMEPSASQAYKAKQVKIEKLDRRSKAYRDSLKAQATQQSVEPTE